MVMDNAPALVDKEGAPELTGVADHPSRGVASREFAYRLDNGTKPIEARPPLLRRPEHRQRGVGNHRHAAAGERHVAHERGKRCRGTVTDEDHVHAQGVELRQSRHEAVHLTGAVRSAEVAEEDEKRRTAQEIAEAVDAVRPVHRSVTQLRGKRLSELHAGRIAPRRWRRRRVAINDDRRE